MSSNAILSLYERERITVGTKVEIKSPVKTMFLNRFVQRNVGIA